MTLPVLRELTLPPSKSTQQTSISVTGSVVVIGANGSGKTRLGAWLDIDSPHKEITHRVAAQKSLAIPTICSTSSLDAAENTLLYGNAEHVGANHKRGNKWGSKPSTHFQNDYQNLLVYLFTDELKASTEYRQLAKETQERIEPPETRLDVVKRIWESVLPHRELLVSTGKAEVRSRCDGACAYPASEMSDGERVIFYLIGQSLAVKSGGILVVDEPELYLHRSLQARLWDSIEAERPDCLFLYLTHDLDFATSRTTATKIWTRSYENHEWDWVVIPNEQSVPERLLLEVIGNRKAVAFVEGDREGLDSLVISRLFPDKHVVACGSATAVIHATASFSALSAIHHLDCLGIIDRDFRSDEQVESLRTEGVLCLDASEIENIFLQEDVLRVVASSLSRTDCDTLVAQVTALVLKKMEGDKLRLVSAIAAARIEDELRCFDAKAVGCEKLQVALDALVGKIDVPGIFESVLSDIDTTLTSNDLRRALRVYNNKGLIPEAAQLFGFRPKELIAHIRRLMAAKQNDDLLNALRKSLPELGAAQCQIEPH